MKRKISLGLIALASMTLASCGGRDKLLILNWGEYISDDVVAQFEEEYNVDVVLSLADSNELFYSKVKSGTTVYDIVVPSDYMVEKMYNHDLLQEIDFTKIPNYNVDGFVNNVNVIINDMQTRNSDIANYFVPYFWGTWGLMYNKNKEGLELAIEDAAKTNVWEVLFNKDVLPTNTKVGMYDIPRYCYSAAMFYHNLDINQESAANLELFKNTLASTNYDIYATDTLKKSISSGNLDLGFMWTGDFLDMLYTDLANTTDLSTLTYDIHIPSNTIAFMDNFVITKKARNVDLAHKFINFMLDPENGYANAGVVGYCTPYQEVYDMIVNYVPGSNLSDDIWLTNWAYAVKKYYPLFENVGNQYQGMVLGDLDRTYINEMITIYNNSKI